MANNPIQILRSTVASNVPVLGTGATDSNIGYNAADGLLYWLDDNDEVQSLDLTGSGGGSAGFAVQRVRNSDTGSSKNRDLSIPSGVEAFILAFDGVGFDNGDAWRVQLGDTVIKTSGYTSYQDGNTDTAGFKISPTIGSFNNFNGVIEFVLTDPGSNLWTMRGFIIQDGSPGTEYQFRGSVQLNSELQTVRVTTNGAFSNFNAGENIAIFLQNTSGTAFTTERVTNNSTGTGIRDIAVPSGVDSFIIGYDNVGYDNSGFLQIAVADTSLVVSGYDSWQDGNTAAGAFQVTPSIGSLNNFDGFVHFSLVDKANHVWVMEGFIIERGTPGTTYSFRGKVTLSSELQTVRITNSNGSANFNSGENSLIYLSSGASGASPFVYTRITNSDTGSTKNRDFAVPAGLDSFFLGFDNVGFDNGDGWLVRLGDTAIVTTGYDSNQDGNSNTNGFRLSPTIGSFNNFNGVIYFDLLDDDANLWGMRGFIIQQGSPGTTYSFIGTVQLSSQLQTVRVTTNGAFSNFNSGENVLAYFEPTSSGGGGGPVEGGAKAWADVDLTGTVTVDNSFNVSGITDDGNGLFTLSWDTDFDNTDYVCVGMTSAISAGNDEGLVTLVPNSRAVGSAQFQCVDVNNAADNLDYDPVMIAVFGDQ